MYLFLVSLVFSAVVVARKCLFCCLLCWNVLKLRLVSYSIAYLVSVVCLLSPLLWETVKCVQLNSISVLSNRYKKRLVYRGSPCVKTEECKDHRLYHATPPCKDTGKGHKYHFWFILFSTPCFTSVSVFMTNFYDVFPYPYYYYHSQITHHTL